MTTILAIAALAALALFVSLGLLEELRLLAALNPRDCRQTTKEKS